MDRWAMLLLVLAVGATLPLQALVNGRLGQGVGGPWVAAAISLSVGALIAIAIVVVRGELPRPVLLLGQPWWALLVGGVVGVMVVSAGAMTVGTLGAATLISWLVAGQLLGSLAFDHFGVLRAAEPISLQRVIGAVLLMAGVVLITRPFARSSTGL